MRNFTALFTSTLLLATPALSTTAKHASAAPKKICQSAEERRAFDLEGLKSQLMVTALVCKQQDKYNAFMARYQPDMAGVEHTLTSYFKRAYGKAATKSYDEYITNLADIQEQDGLKAGNVFCDNLPAMFDEVLSLHESFELHDYVNSKAIVQPINFESCPIPQAPARKTKTKTKHT